MQRQFVLILELVCHNQAIKPTNCGKAVVSVVKLKFVPRKSAPLNMNGEFFSFGPSESSYFFNCTLYVSPIEIASHTLILCIFHQLQIPSGHSYGIFLPVRAFLYMKSSDFFIPKDPNPVCVIKQ